MQEQFATIVLQREANNIQLANAMVEEAVVQEDEIAESEERMVQQQIAQDRDSKVERSAAAGGDAPSTPAAQPGGGQGGESSQLSRQERRARLEQQAANTGILALLSSQSSNAAGGVQDIIGTDTEASQDYDQVFRNIDRVASEGGGGGGGTGSGGGTDRSAIRGERATQGGGITTSIGGIGGAKPVREMQRSSQFITSELAPISNSGDVIDNEAVSVGARDIDDVKAVVAAHTPAIEYCYQREKKRQPDLKGKIVVRFTILPNGRVKDPIILSSTLNSSNVERCILSRISRWDDFGEIDPSLGNASFRQVYSFGF